MRRFWVLLAVAAAASAAVFGGATGATAQTAVATLTGEQLASCHAETIGGAAVVCGPLETGAGSFRFRARCTNPPGDTGRVSWTVTGTATGPYTGTFTETGTAEFTNNLLTNVQVNFHIDSALADVDGRKFITAPFTGDGLCRGVGGAFVSRVFGTVRYEAIIKPATGGSFADEGTVSLLALGLTASDPRVAEAETTAGFVVEDFISDLLVATPLLPDAKEQCKDEGFLIFGVFENQGDCVSFVSTKGKNEPGKNEPSVP